MVTVPPALRECFKAMLRNMLSEDYPTLWPTIGDEFNKVRHTTLARCSLFSALLTGCHCSLALFSYFFFPRAAFPLWTRNSLQYLQEGDANVKVSALVGIHELTVKYQ